MYALCIKNDDPSGMTTHLCILVMNGLMTKERHKRITNIGTPLIPREGQILDGCTTRETRVEKCDGFECKSRLSTGKVMILAPDLAEEIRKLL